MFAADNNIIVRYSNDKTGNGIYYTKKIDFLHFLRNLNIDSAVDRGQIISLTHFSIQCKTLH